MTQENLKKEWFIIGYLISHYSILFYISLATVTIRYLLFGKIDIRINNLVTIISMLPAVPVFWLMIREDIILTDRFTQLYLPLSGTLFLVFLLIFRIVRVMKIKHES